MSNESKQEYLALIRQQYRKAAGKQDRTRLIDEVVRNLGYHRNSIISLRLDGLEEPRKGVDFGQRRDAMRYAAPGMKYGNEALERESRRQDRRFEPAYFAYTTFCLAVCSPYCNTMKYTPDGSPDALNSRWYDPGASTSPE